jgi:hypothetical protein
VSLRDRIERLERTWFLNTGFEAGTDEQMSQEQADFITKAVWQGLPPSREFTNEELVAIAAASYEFKTGRKAPDFSDRTYPIIVDGVLVGYGERVP